MMSGVVVGGGRMDGEANSDKLFLLYCLYLI